MRYNNETVVQLLKKYISFKTICERTNLRQNHVALVIKRGKILDIASNALGTRGKGCGYNTRTIHAERAVIKKLGDNNKLNGAILIVIKISKYKNEIGYSEPCHSCKCHLEKCIKQYGLKRIYYST
jgi:hypothetical protein